MAKRKAKAKQAAAYAIITRSLLSEAGRFLPQERGAALLEKCRISEEGAYCNSEYAPDDNIELLREYDGAMQTLQEYAQYTGDEGLEDLVVSFRQELRNEAATIAKEQSKRDAARLKEEAGEITGDDDIFISGDLAALDVTGLEPREASTLALLLNHWNEGGDKVYKWRNGKRYLNAFTIKLNHPFVKTLPFYDDLVEMYETGENVEHVTREPFELKQESIPKSKRTTGEEISRQARVTKQSQNEQEGLGMPVGYSVGGAKQKDIFG